MVAINFKIAVILVQYNIKLFNKDLVGKLAKNCKVFVVENNSRYKFPIISGVTIIQNHNKGGLAGAYNSALGKLYDDQELERVILVDDDSNLEDLIKYVNFIKSMMNEPIFQKYVAVGPIYKDINTGSIGRPIRLGRFIYKRINVNQYTNDIIPVSFLINSFCCWDVRTLKTEKLFFDESLFVDHIDTDMCMRVNTLGHQIGLLKNFIFEHRIGDRVAYSLLGIKLQSGGHSIARRRSIGHNTAVLLKRYYDCTSFQVLCLVRMIYESIGILLVEKQKFRKLKALWAGFLL